MYKLLFHSSFRYCQLSGVRVYDSPPMFLLANLCTFYANRKDLRAQAWARLFFSQKNAEKLDKRGVQVVSLPCRHKTTTFHHHS